MDAANIIAPIASVLSAAIPAGMAFFQKTPKQPSFSMGALPKQPTMPVRDNSALRAGARLEMMKRKKGGREDTILSDKETLGG